MKKIPKKLKIGGHIYKIKIVNDFVLEGNDGDSNRFTSMIRINELLSQSQREATLIHEIFHCLNAQIGEKELGHLFLESLSEQLYQVLKDNRLLS